MNISNITVGLLTLGCKVNQYESEAIAELIEKKGFIISDINKPCTAYIINTCTVTAESDRKARQAIRKMIAKNPKAFILVTGCYAQLSADAIAKIEGVDYICGNTNKLSTVSYLCSLLERGEKNGQAEICVPSLDGADFENMSIKHFERTRAYVKIEDGCESKCAYCTIPMARGDIRSKPFDKVITEVKELVDGGCREIVLTGIETGSYGKDLLKGEDLASLLCEIDKIKGIGRVRLGSLDPTVIKPDFVEKIKNLKCLAPHFHLSLQSGSSKILAKMKRKYNAEQAMRSIALLREAIPHVQFTTDIIVGFPDETEDDFLQSCEFAKRAGFLMIHVFPYSKRKGTPAALMTDQIDDTVKKDRVHRLSQISCQIRDRILNEKIKNDGTVTVLFESFKDGYAYGHTAEFIEVKVKSEKLLHAVFRTVRLISHTQEYAEGVLLD